MKRTMMAACILSLVACGGSKDDVATDQRDDWAARQASLVYSFPDNQQQQVPVPAPVVLRFSSPVAETAPNIRIREAGGSYISDSDIQLEWVDGKRGLILTPDSKLKPLTEYQVEVPAIELERGTAAARTIQFTTRGLYEGPKSLVAEDNFKVIRTIPDGTNFPVMDFSSFRVQFSQPLDQTTVKYGSAPNATVRLTGPDGLVDAHVLVGGHYLTIDPKEDLKPGVEYSLDFTSGLQSTYSENLPGGFGGGQLALSVKVSPKDTTSPTTGQRAAMVQDIADTGELSPLTGAPINLVPMSSVLLGKDTATQASGTLAAELAFVPNFPDVTPFRVKRGSLIEGASIEVRIGGEVAAGFNSGKVRMDFLSDATGYLLPNPYSNSDDAPRQVRLFMDVSVSTETPRANGAITQDILHIELVGTAIVEDGQMVINAVGVVEPNVLAAERAVGILSFYMKAHEDQDNPPELAVDDRPLEVQSWSHFDTRSISVLQPIVVNFNKPIDPESITSESIVLKESSLSGTVNIGVDVITRGTSIVINPKERLRQPYQIPGATAFDATLDPVKYSIEFGDGITDINGVSAISLQALDFEFVPYISEVDWVSATYVSFFPIDQPLSVIPQPGFAAERLNQSIILLMTYPGYPCAIDETEMDVDAGIAGRCEGTLAVDLPSIEAEEIQHRSASDLLPIMSLPANMPIVVQASQDFEPDSIRLSSNFVVQKLNDPYSFSEEVDGVLHVEGKRITFTPSKPWEDGALYHYIMRSNGDDLAKTNAVVCDGTQAICDLKGRPLQTKLYHADVDPAYGNLLRHRVAYGSAGGPDIRSLFFGAPETDNVLQALTASPVDANANFYHDVNVDSFPPYPGTSILGDNRRSAISEEGVDPAVLDPSPNSLDPGGVSPIANSSKLVSSTLWRQTSVELDGSGQPVPDPLTNEEFIIIDGYPMQGVNVGCGYIYPDIQDVNDILETFYKEYLPLECPENKFTYLHSSISAEVTGDYVDGKGIRVKIWPGQIAGTSLKMYTILGGQNVTAIDSGKQMMRMRYAKDDPDCVDTPTSPCRRTQPIEGWIANVGGVPTMSAVVDLHIDAAALGSTLGFLEGVRHNMLNVPATMNLEGEISFNENGQMVINQINQNDVNLQFELTQFNMGTPGNHFRQKMSDFELIVPAGGSLIQYISDIIK